MKNTRGEWTPWGAVLAAVGILEIGGLLMCMMIAVNLPGKVAREVEAVAREEAIQRHDEQLAELERFQEMTLAAQVQELMRLQEEYLDEVERRLQ